MYKLKLG